MLKLVYKNVIPISEINASINTCLRAIREGSRLVEAFFGWIIVALIHHFLVKCCAFSLGMEMGKNYGNGDEETSAHVSVRTDAIQWGLTRIRRLAQEHKIWN